MKDILIVAKQRRDPGTEPYNTIQREASKYKESVKEIFETTFLISGPKSFEIAMKLCRTASDLSTQVAVFEIESCLLDPTKT